MSKPNEKPAKRSPKSDLSGRQLGDFRLLRRLGRGAMAEVYLAEQCLLRRKVAVKVLNPELAEDGTYLKRFQREAQAAASLIHANIVQIHEVGHREEFHFIAQEYVQGQNLHQWLNRSGPADLPHALSIMRQAASALAKAAEQGVVHRDIKPENILLTRSGEVKVADFGLAQVVREGEAPDLTQVGITMGTPLYMSPEQVEGISLDPRSDIYSLGVTCYHMLAGSPPFSSDTALGVAVQHLKKQPAALENLRPDLPAALCRIVHRMLVKDPAGRYQSAKELLRDLRRLQQEHFAEGWPEDLPGWDSEGFESEGDPLGQQTRQLDGLMKTAAFERTRTRSKGLLAVALAATFLMGGAVAWLVTRDDFLLADVQAMSSGVERRETALQQYMSASRVGTEEAWRSVIEYFPGSSFSRAAEKQLARIYLHQGNYDRALAIFDELAAASEIDPRLQAYGLAGRYGVLTLQGRYDESAEVLERLLPIRDDLQDAEMQEMLDYAIQRNQSKLDQSVSEQWEEWFTKLQQAD
ncbi:MAG TPA: serine/threonine-protein kinase [Thermoguttaceae bacterium]|nr:serine/threonine-protein kinase [Thermoguttaceae bacterium]